MALVLAISQLINAGRTALDPVGFATYLGFPLATPADAALVQVYGLRAAFIGLFALALIALREFTVLKWFALLAVLMPLGDLLLTIRAGAPVSVVSRHAAYVAYIMAVVVLLHRSKLLQSEP
jgi:hypothetical protein